MTAGPQPRPSSSGGAPTPRRMRRRLAIGGGITAALVFLQQLALALARGTAIDAVGRMALGLWLAFLLLLGARWLWRTLTYRVGVRLFISYLLIGLTPFAICGALALLSGYVFVGQCGAIRLGEEVEREESRLASLARSALLELRQAGLPAAVRRIAEAHPGADAASVHAAWLVASGKASWRSGEVVGLDAPGWAPDGEWRGPVVIGARAYRAVIERDGERVVAAVVPLDIANARAFGRGQWFELRFVVVGPSAARSGAKALSISVGTHPGDERPGVWVNGRPVPSDEVEPGWVEGPPKTGSFWQRARLMWFSKSKPLRLWQDGAIGQGWDVVTLIQVRIAGAIHDFFGSSEGLGGEVQTMFRVVATVFGVVYLVAAGFAALLIVSVARSTARLTRGAREVGRGDLAHRIPVRRRDQLGDLAVAFNAMTESVQGMLSQVAEKERLAHEMALAREIQESLLPKREFTHDGLWVFAHFRPAADVGGDYFDLFPFAPGRLILAVGDVAGHGLSTGLLMAMVKSAVAALVQEGHRGKDLLARLNSLVLQHPTRHRMVTLATLEVDATAQTVEVTNTGHPPVYVIRPDGAVEELLLGALPLGGPWSAEPASRRVAFPPGSKLVVYSDGLVEALGPDGQPFGYEALRELLADSADLSAEQLLAAILAALDRFTTGGPLADDLTVLVVESSAVL